MGGASKPMKILIIEDEAPIRRFLKASFLDQDIEWIEADTARQGIQLAAQGNPDVILLDLGLPDEDGLAVISEIRSWSTTPIIVLSARGQERDKVAALDHGADDYLTKPFSTVELFARIRVSLRHRNRNQEDAVLDLGSLRIDVVGRRVTVGGTEILLTPIEFRLLVILAQNEGRVVTQKQLLNEVWGYAYEDSSHTLRVHMANLRQKIDRAAGSRLIRTETGVGYRFIAQ